MKTALLSSCVLGVGLLTGCAELVPNMRDSTVSKFGPGGLVTQPIEQVDLISLVTNGVSKQQPGATDALNKKNFPNEFEAALATMRRVSEFLCKRYGLQ